MITGYLCENFWKSYIGWISKNPEIRPSYHFSFKNENSTLQKRLKMKIYKFLEIMSSYGGTMRCPKKHVKDDFSRDSIFIIFWNAPKSKNLNFGSFSVWKMITCLFFKMPHFFTFEFFEMPHFSFEFWFFRHLMVTPVLILFKIGSSARLYCWKSHPIVNFRIFRHDAGRLLENLSKQKQNI